MDEKIDYTEEGKGSENSGGPIIERDNRKTRPYSKRIIFFGILLIGAVIAVIATQAQRNIDANRTVQEQQRNYAPKRDFAGMAAEYQANAQRTAAQVIVSFEPTSKEIVQVAAPTMVPASRRRKYYSNQADQQAAAQLRMMNIQAIMTPPKVDGFGEETGKTAQPNDPMSALMTQLNAAQRAGAITAAGGTGAGLNTSQLSGLLQQAGGIGGADPNRQSQKADFLRNSGSGLTAQGYSENLPQAQKYYLELKAGTVIPGILVTGLNSDLPGPVVGQVSENVWDSTHGRHILIPKGTKVLGVYDSQVTFGQKRVLVVWNRLIFPNGTTLNIAGAPGLDQAGYSGMKGKVNEHWGRLISTALLASLFVTGAEVISPKQQQTAMNQVKSPGDIAAEQAANVILEMSAKLMNKTMDIQPTITIRPGGRFNIFVEKDIVFPEPFPIEY